MKQSTWMKFISSLQAAAKLAGLTPLYKIFIQLCNLEDLITNVRRLNAPVYRHIHRVSVWAVKAEWKLQGLVSHSSFQVQTVVPTGIRKWGFTLRCGDYWLCVQLVYSAEQLGKAGCLRRRCGSPGWGREWAGKTAKVVTTSCVVNWK